MGNHRMQIDNLKEMASMDIDFVHDGFQYDLFIGVTRRKPGEGTAECVLRWDDDQVKARLVAKIKELYLNRVTLKAKNKYPLDRFLEDFDQAWTGIIAWVKEDTQSALPKVK